MLSSDRSVLGTNMGKIGIQSHTVTGGFELEQQKSEERTKNSIPNKRTRTSLVDMRVCILEKFCYICFLHSPCSYNNNYNSNNILCTEMNVLFRINF